MVKKKYYHDLLKNNKEINERWVNKKPRKKPTPQQRMDFGLARNREKKYEEG